jgi:hypothetical protein
VRYRGLGEQRVEVLGQRVRPVRHPGLGIHPGRHRTGWWCGRMSCQPMPRDGKDEWREAHGKHTPVGDVGGRCLLHQIDHCAVGTDILIEIPISPAMHKTRMRYTATPSIIYSYSGPARLGHRLLLAAARTVPGLRSTAALYTPGCCTMTCAPRNPPCEPPVYPTRSRSRLVFVRSACSSAA